MKHSTQSDIARKLNVTRITVSKALRNHPDISDGMKKKVRDAANELGYTPNLIAKNLTSRKTFTLGLVIPDLENSFFAYAADSIIDKAGEKNYSVIVAVSRENGKTEKLNLEKLIGMRVDGLLVSVSQQTKDPKIFELINDLNIPLVFFDRKFEGIDFPNVTFDDKNGAISALNKIIEAGYKEIAHFAGFRNISIGKERYLGYKLALENNGIEIKQNRVIEGGFDIKDGYDGFMKLYKSGDLPEVIFTVNDRVALGVYKAAGESGVKIPDDIGVAGFGFNDTAQSLSPSLAIINQDPRKIGEVAADLLIETINNPVKKNPVNIKIKEEFLWNESLLKKFKNNDRTK